MRKPVDYIIFPLDVSTFEEAKRYVSLLAGDVGMFKVGLELFISCGPEIVRYINDQGGAGVFLDLKLHDIPVTVQRAVASVADLDVRFLTVHCADSERMLEAAVEGSAGKVGILGVTVLTSVGSGDLAGSGLRDEYVSDVSSLVLKRAEMAKRSGCAGVICSGLEVGMLKGALGPEFLAITPGIRPAWGGGGGDDQRRVTTPAQAVKSGSDYLVIGRPIRDAEDPVAAARRIAEEIATVL